MSAPDVTVVVCTCDREAQLERLLQSLQKQQTALSFDIVVVDNNPATASTSRLQPLFKGVHWVGEPRRGLSFARNAGIRAATGRAIAFVDDDIEVPPGWLEAIASGVVNGAFDVVMGPVQPLSLETEAERLFEAYGGHGFSATAAEYDGRWLRSQRFSLPLWELGGVGNAAFRRELFFDPRNGFFDEALGVGTPAGSWGDLYLLYRMLRGNTRMRREPAATVIHAHRRSMEGLERQLCNYRRGEVCFCILAFLRHRDFRAVTHLFYRIPAWRARLLLEEIARRLRGRSLYSFRLMWREFGAYLEGPGALVASLRHAAPLRASGRSQSPPG